MSYDDELDILRARVGALEQICSHLIADKPALKESLRAVAEMSPVYEHGRNTDLFRNNYRGTFWRVIED